MNKQQLNIENQINENEKGIQRFKDQKSKLETDLLPLQDKFISIKIEKYPDINLTKELMEKIFENNPNLQRISIIKREIKNLENKIDNLTQKNKILNITLKRINEIKNRKAKNSVIPEKSLQPNIDVSDEELNKFMKEAEAERKLEESVLPEVAPVLPEVAPVLPEVAPVLPEVAPIATESLLEAEKKAEELRALRALRSKKLREDIKIKRQKMGEKISKKRDIQKEEKKTKSLKIVKKPKIVKTKPKTIKRDVAKEVKNENKNSFRATLIQTRKKVKPMHPYNPKVICNSILTSGKNLTKKYYFPSEFPNLTKLKSVTQ